MEGSRGCVSVMFDSGEAIRMVGRHSAARDRDERHRESATCEASLIACRRMPSGGCDVDGVADRVTVAASGSLARSRRCRSRR